MLHCHLPAFTLNLTWAKYQTSSQKELGSLG
jgi:hypothetical protein